LRILDVSPRRTFPAAQGSSVRTSHLLRHLSGRHEVRQFSFSRRGWTLAREEEQVRVTPGYVEHRHRGRFGGLFAEASERAWVRAPVATATALAISRPPILDDWLAWADVVLVEFPWLFSYCRARRPAAPLVLSAHNVEPDKFAAYAECFRSPFARGAWLRLIARMEARAVAGADLVLAVSERDRGEMLRRYRIAPERVVVIPNGADTDAVRPAGEAERREARRALGLPDRPTVIFAGADVPPNRAGLRWIESLARRSDAWTFLVVGAVSRPRRSGSLHATGLVDDFALHLRAADAALCPITHGGGTKIKLLEGLAAGLPTVAFEHSIQGLDIRDGEHLLVAPESEDGLLEALARISGDAALARRIGGNAARFIAQRHQWKAAAARLDECLTRLVVGPDA
jgi:glycosyltransferase involved in cell wall biosynthesis